MNYIGSKYSLIDFLVESIDDVTGFNSGDGRTFADLFAGTGIVGATFKERGYKVISNDIQYYSYVINKHLIENCKEYGNSKINDLNNIKFKEGFIYKNYCSGSGSGRNYFTDDNGKKCDAIREEIDNLKTNKKISNGEYYYCLASLIDSVDKCANTASVYGAFLKHIKESAKKDLELRPLPTINGPKGKVYNEDINILIKRINGDILYLDPPYNSRQYCSNYHLLETIAKYDNPEISGLTGLRNYNEQKSSFCSKRTVCEAFDNLIKNANFKYIFLSYNNEGLMSLSEIKEIMSYYGRYLFKTKDYKRFQADKSSNRNIKSYRTKEYLHCLVK